MAVSNNEEPIGSEDDIFNQMSSEDLLAHLNSLALADEQSPEDIIIAIEEGRYDIENTLLN